MFTVTYRLPLGVALFIASSPASADIVLESDPVPGIILAVWSAIGFIMIALMGLWQDRFVDPVEFDPNKRQRLAFHRGFGAVIALLVGFLFGAAFLWTFGPMIALSVEPWLNENGQAVAKLAATIAAIAAFTLSALYLPELFFPGRRRLPKTRRETSAAAKAAS